MTDKTGSVRRSQGLDLLKLLCAFMIIFIHRPFPKPWGPYITALSRCAVPVFFMISGYFSPLLEKKGNVWTHVRKLIILTLLNNLMFILWNAYVYRMDVIEYLNRRMTPARIRDLLLLNSSPFSPHLWYLSAILYTTLIFELFRRLHIQKLLYVLTPFLLLGDLVFGKYSLLLLGREFDYILVRNFLFVGIPYYCIGRLFFQRPKLTNFRCFLSACLSVGFGFLTMLELHTLLDLNLNATRDHYLSTTFLAVSLFLLFLHFPLKGNVTGFFAGLGKKWSTGIYLFHPLLNSFFLNAARWCGREDLLAQYKVHGTLFLCAATILLMILLEPCRILHASLKKESRGQIH